MLKGVTSIIFFSILVLQSSAQIAGIEFPQEPVALTTEVESNLYLSSNRSVASCKIPPGKSPYRSRNIKRIYPVMPTGPGTSDIIRRSPKYRIPYHTYGISPRTSCVQNERLESVENYINALVSKYPHLYSDANHPLLEQYRLHMQELINSPHAFGTAIDRCFAQTLQRWNKCRGRYAKTAREMRKISNKLRVQVMPAAFYVTQSTGGNLWAAGMASSDLRSMFAMVSAIGGNTTGSPFIHTFESLVCWEMGNNFGMNMGYYASTLRGEIGFQSPCKVLRKR